MHDPQTGDCDVEFTHERMTPAGSPSRGGVTVATEDGIDPSLTTSSMAREARTSVGRHHSGPTGSRDGHDGPNTAVYDLSSVGAVDMVKPFHRLRWWREPAHQWRPPHRRHHGRMGRARGVNVSSRGTPQGFKAGEVVLTGNVQELAVAGQEFYIDNVCVIAGEEPACATDVAVSATRTRLPVAPTLRPQLRRAPRTTTDPAGTQWRLDLQRSIPAFYAPDFTAMDINGVQHNLHALLDAGKKVIIQFTATWSGPTSPTTTRASFKTSTASSPDR